jgi:uncharacterized protein (TIGR02147 family)
MAWCPAMHQDSYQLILKAKLEERCKANPRYSLRAFSRDLGVGPGRLSSILNHRIGLSEKAAKQIGTKLGLTSEETNYFCQLVVASDSRSKEKRNLAQKYLMAHEESKNSYLTIQLEVFKVISDWYHFAIVDLIKTKGFKNDLEWVSNRLGISKYEVEMAINRLKKLDLISERKGFLIDNGQALATPTDIPSEAIKNFHRQVIQKALNALTLQSIDERDFSALTVAINTEDLPKIKKRIRDFRKSINSFSEANKMKNDEVYCLSVQFFRLTQKESK